MKKKKAQLIVLALSLLVVAGVIAAVLWLVPNDDSETTTYKVIDRTDTELKYAKVTNDLDTFEVIKNQDSDMMWTAPGLEGLPELKANYYSFARSCTLLTAAHKMTGISEDGLAQYGLDTPQATVELEFEDGETITILVGDSVGIESRRYFTIAGEEDTVYAGSESLFTYFLSDRYELLDTLLAPNNGSNSSSDTADYWEFTNAAGVLYRFDKLEESYTDGYGNSYPFEQTLPEQGYVTSTAVSEYFSRLMQFNADSVYKANPTEADLSQLGFDTPLTTLRIGFLGDEENELEAAESYLLFVEHEGDYLAYREDLPVVWLVADYMVTWLDLEPDTMTTRYFLAPPATDVSSVSVDFGTESFVFAVSEEGALSYNGEAIYETDSANLYKMLCSVNSNSTNGAGERGALALTITFTYRSGGTARLQLYDAGTRRYAVYLNGADTGYTIRAAFVERLLEECNHAIAGEDVSLDW